VPPAKVSSWLPAYSALALIWGFSFFFIKVGLESFTPIGVAVGRISFGAIALVIVALITRSPMPPRWSWGYLFIASLLWVSIPWTLFSFAETQVSSALAGIVNGAAPLMTLLVILIAFPEEKPTLARVLGLILGFIGIIVVIGPESLFGSPLGIAALLGAITCYGIAFPFARRYLTGPTARERISPISMALALMVGGLIVTLPLTAISGIVDGPVTTGPFLSVLALGALGSGIAYVLNFRVVTYADATTASTVAFLTPLVAIIAGAVLLAEPMTWNQPVGGVLVVAGAATAQGLLRLPGRVREG